MIIRKLTPTPYKLNNVEKAENQFFCKIPWPNLSLYIFVVSHPADCQ